MDGKAVTSRIRSFTCSFAACFLTAALLASPLLPRPAAAQTEEPSGNVLTVIVTGLQQRTGQVLWALYSRAEAFDAFDDTVADATGSCAVTAPTCRITIEDIPSGTYALMVGHDVDMDGEIDRSPFSDELKGISNYTSKLWWAPSFETAQFDHAPPETVIEIPVF